MKKVKDRFSFQFVCVCVHDRQNGADKHLLHTDDWESNVLMAVVGKKSDLPFLCLPLSTYMNASE